MPPFDDQRDNIDAYLQRFERVAKSQAWPEVRWATFLSTLLKGKALDVYSRLDPDKVEVYKEVKQALLKRYEMTEEGFRQKFRTVRIEMGETFTQFLVRVGNYFDRWVDLSGSARTWEGIRDLLLREQLLHGVSTGLCIFLKERKPESVGEMARLAEHFVEAREGVTGRSVHPVSQGGDRFKKGSDSQVKKSVQSEKRDSRTFVPMHERKCYGCGDLGHMASSCSKWKSKLKGNTGAGSVVIESVSDVSGEPVVEVGEKSEIDSQGVEGSDTSVTDHSGEDDALVTSGTTSGTMCGMCGTMPVRVGKLCGHSVNVLRDSGCNGVVVKRSLVDEDCFVEGELHNCTMGDGRVCTVPVAWVPIDSPFYKGTVKAACLETPLFDVMLGNIPGARAPEDPLPEEEVVEVVEAVGAVETRRQRKVREQGMKPMKTFQSVGISLSRLEFIQKQKEDSGLDKVRKLVQDGRQKMTEKGVSRYFSENEMLYREYVSHDGLAVVQAVVPTELRSEVMKVCHESLMGGHMGVKKTLDRVISQFYWPGVQGDVRRHCLSCDVCQRTIPKGKVGKVPLGQMPLISTPFERIAVDLIGPLYPVTDRGNRYILTVVDYATRYPEAVALPRIETEYVAEALLEIFSRVGVPKEMLSDMGAQFTSSVMKEVSRLLSLKQLTTTPYHPMCNGLVERFNGTLKLMLKRLSAEKPTDWDRYLSALLFAYREVPQESLGFSPFELLYGRKVRGPVQVLRELWTKDIPDPETRTTYEYVLDLQNRLEETIEVAHQSLVKASGRYRKHFNHKVKVRQMKAGDKVLILLPTNHNKLLLQWKGPFVIEESFGSDNYRVRVGDKLKTYHANLLKKYIDRESSSCSTVVSDVSVSLPQYVCTGIVDVGDDNVESDVEGDLPEIVSPPLKAKETYLDVNISQDLSDVQKTDVRELLAEFSDVLTDLPGRTNCMEYKVRLTSSDPVRSRPYPIPHHMRDRCSRDTDYVGLRCY
ncbi:uncharacterized protein LOC124255665 [Haliotis rubra]|uniref:uncharacterized protein LOC124255665 n=1 Tax=Haliotis rubra TaxID=36100 RepID=UPI001EE60EC0|nr:uncharacterized protein LOC124255665 [Haliotis rubra]